LDVLHAAHYILTRIVKLGSGNTHLFFGTKILAFRLLHLCDACVVCKASTFKLLPSGLESGSVSKMIYAQSQNQAADQVRGSYLVFFHHGNSSVQLMEPVGIDVLGVVAVKIRNTLVGSTSSDEAIAKFRLRLKLIAMRHHCASQGSGWGGSVLVLECITSAGDPFRVRRGCLL
jgi:hypothetical protein